MFAKNDLLQKNIILLMTLRTLTFMVAQTFITCLPKLKQEINKICKTIINLL